MLSKLGFLKGHTASVRKRGEQPQENEREMVQISKPITGVSATDGLIASFLPRNDRLNFRCVSRAVQQGIDYWNPIKINQHLLRSFPLTMMEKFLALPNNRLLIITLNELKILDITTGTCLAIFRYKDDCYFGKPIVSMTDGKLILKTRDEVRIWDTNTGEGPVTIPFHERGEVLLLLDGKLATYRRDLVQIWDTTTGECLVEFQADNTAYVNIRGVLPLLDGKLATYATNLVQTWDTTTGECLVKFQVDTDYIGGVLSLQDGKLATYAKNLVQIWDTNTGECLVSLREAEDVGILYVDILTNDKLVTTLNNSLKIWDTKTGECLGSITAPEFHYFSDVVALPDDKLIIRKHGGVASEEAIEIWDVGFQTLGAP